MFIAFEGLDGSGSSTQARLLVEKLETQGYKTFVTQEPTATNPVGRMIRDVLQHKWEASPETLQILFAADRAEHLRKEIVPAQKNSQVAITVRYFFSSIAYGSLNIQDIGWIKQLNCHYPLPDLTFLLKLDPALCMERIQKRQLAIGGTLELFEKQERLKKIWKTYEVMPKDYPNFHLIDASKSIEPIADEIWGIVEKKLG
jgi:dTMP kinase